ncbi:HNH endonuclease [Lentzea sp. JNUCC 0626]|uniref:HNH endonuclease n=1 Tax=Lentzea sp. JNUCC 0626 TaxID=3367513 RepID=UPI00374A450B
MGLGDITANAVRTALAEHDQLGMEKFCDRYGFDRFRSYLIADGSRRYGTRVIAAAAHGHLPGRAPLSPDDVADEELVKQTLEGLGFDLVVKQPPDWAREELVLACSLLFANNRKAHRATHKPAQDLAAFLQQLPVHAPQDRGRNFRSNNSVQRKLNDLMTSLPEYPKKKTRGGTLDEQVLAEFLEDEPRLHEEAAAIREKYSPKAWALFSAEGERKYGGNSGYPDVLGSSYVYDNKVSNSKRLGKGNVIVVRNDEDALGVARVSHIEQQDGVPKVQRGCPRCGTKFDERSKQRPKYRCRKDSCHFEFEQPAEKTVEVTQYVAYYGGTWRALDGAITAEQVKEACTDGAVQNAIRPLDIGKLEDLLAKVQVNVPAEQDESPPVTKVQPSRRKSPDNALGGRGGTGRIPKGGRREAKTKARNGQGPFRRELIRRYGHACAVTGRAPAEVLQAAHLRDFAAHETHNPDEGVLLRADVHLLFDNELLAVNPTTWKVVLAPSLADYPAYADLDGADFVKGPCSKAVTDHFIAVTSTWK